MADDPRIGAMVERWHAAAKAPLPAGWSPESFVRDLLEAADAVDPLRLLIADENGLAAAIRRGGQVDEIYRRDLRPCRAGRSQGGGRAVSVRSRSCVLVECDGTACGRDKGWPEGDGPWHFDTLDGAMTALLGEEGMGWTRLPDGRLLCRACSEVADCSATGHQWTEWRPHSRSPHVVWRHCRHCGDFDEQLREVANGG